MIGVEADVVEVVVLAAGADAFLGIGGAAGCVGAFRLAEEDGHELVHAGIREQQVRRIGQEARGGDDGVLLRLEEVEERLADFVAGRDACGAHLKLVSGCELKVESFYARESQRTCNVQLLISN